MGLINCPKCGMKVSDKADKCIYCGWTLKEDKGSTVSARDAFNHACAKYDEAVDLIKELSVLTKVVAKDFSVDVKNALSHYDLFLQCILLRVALQDGLFVENEKIFIEKITDYADLMNFINHVLGDQSLSWQSISWDSLGQMNQELRVKISNIATEIMSDSAELFVTPFAVVDATTPKNYIDELVTITYAIIVDLALVDGDSSKSNDFEEETKEGFASLVVLISKKWNEVKGRHKK